METKIHQVLEETLSTFSSNAVAESTPSNSGRCFTSYEISSENLPVHRAIKLSEAYKLKRIRFFTDYFLEAKIVNKWNDFARLSFPYVNV